ncbi:MAG: PorT family protein, partial [Clostridia bacterium]|nr:PorT family protein [Clostridia bacterium]
MIPMKFRSVFLFALLVIPLTAVSQQFNAGMKAGISATQISGDQLSGFDKPGLYGGGFVNIYYKPKYCIQMELSFIQKGSKKNPNPDRNDFETYILNLNYLEFPLLIRHDHNEYLSLEAGLALAALLNYREEVNEGAPLAPTRTFGKTDFSALVGGYFRFSDKLILNLRYEHSILPVRKHSSGISYRLNKGQYN